MVPSRLPQSRKHEEHLYTIEEIHIRAETVTPLLRDILDFHPAPHWGINE